jgi:hypothetical protein
MDMQSIEQNVILIPAKRAFAVIGIGRTKGYQLIAEGHLVARKLDSKTMIEAASLRAYAAGLPTFPAKGAAQPNRCRRG